MAYQFPPQWWETHISQQVRPSKTIAVSVVVLLYRESCPERTVFLGVRISRLWLFEDVGMVTGLSLVKDPGQSHVVCSCMLGGP
jgi:hypothetical protein